MHSDQMRKDGISEPMIQALYYGFVANYVKTVSGPSDSGSRSTRGDTGEGELRTGSINVRFHSECHTTRYV